MKENFDEKEKNPETKGDETQPVSASLEASNSDVAELVKLGSKQLFLQRVMTACVAGMFLVLLISVLVVVPKVTTTLSKINSVATKAEKSLENVDAMANSVETSAGNLDKLLDENGEKLTSAVTSISEIDFEGLNKAITDLQSAVGPLAKLFGKSN